jgi:HAD superfamily hydrolase (TIGR01509 family)
VSRLQAPGAIVLDFNGTLSLDEPVLDVVFRELFAEQGVVFDSAFYYRELAGLADPEIVNRAYALHGVTPAPGAVEAMLAGRLERYREIVAREPTVTPQAAAFVRDAAARVPVAIGSGALRAEIEFVLAQHGLRDCIAAIVTADDVMHGKPHPETYLRCLDLLRRTHPTLAPGDCLVFEDSRHGVAAARAAGMRCAVVASTPDAEARALADAVVQDLHPGLIDWGVE